MREDLANYAEHLTQKETYSASQYLASLRTKTTKDLYWSHLKSYFGFLNPQLQEIISPRGEQKEQVCARAPKTTSTNIGIISKTSPQKQGS